jgi:ankyrin repeat protein
MQCYELSGQFQSGGPQFAGSTINTGGGNVNFEAHDSQQTSIHARFKVSDYEGQKNSIPDRVQGTCKWFLLHDRYQGWRDSGTDNLLWVSADPGCGKSVLAKSLIEHELKSTESISTCYFFFKDDEEQGKLQNALCGLLHQLFTFKPTLLRYALLEEERNGERLRLEPSTLWRLLMTAAADPAAGQVVCILDALDECQERDRHILIDLLKKFYSHSSVTSGRRSSLKFLVTSRPYHGIEIRFQELVDKVPTVRLAGEEESIAISEEIRLVIRTWVAQIASERRLPTHVRDLLLAKLTDIPNRTYLWLHLIFEEIWETFDSTVKKLSALVEKLPESVYDAYERILARSKDKIEARRILQAVIAAIRPLTLKEMDVILAMKDNTRSYHDLDLEGEVHTKRRIRNTCGLFLSVSDAKVYLIHQTAKEFLVRQESETLRIDQNEWRNSFVLRHCNYMLAQICVRYLSFTNFESGPFVNYVMSRYRGSRDQKLLDCLISRYQFLEYRATQWGTHVRRSQLGSEDDELVSLSLSLCDAQSWRGELWSAVYKMHEKVEFGPMTNHTSIHIACLIGIERVVSLLLDRGTDINEEISDVENPLQIASAAGHEAVVQVLLERGANVNVNSGNQGGALQLASEYGYEEISKLLLEHGANVNADDGRKGTALIAASRRGHVEMVRFLLGYGAIINMKGGEYNNALHAALRGGHEGTVRLLLEEGGDVEAQTGRHSNLLWMASNCGHHKIVELLLSKGANVNAQDGELGNALQAASHSGEEKIVELLLSKGANVNVQGGEYGSALQEASYRGSEKIVKLLLSKDANVNIQGGRYGNALQAASYLGKKKIVKLLLSKGANVNTQGGRYGNALQAASYLGKEKIVKLLLSKGANVNTQGGRYGNVLQAASYLGNKKIVKLLLSKGANVNTQGGKYGNALQAASYSGEEKIVELLLSRGADMNAQGGEYGSALQAASYRGEVKIVELLLSKGANVNIQGGEYGNALQAASYSNEDKVVELLLSKGANVNAQGGEYGTALQAASYRGRKKIVELLLSKGAIR